MTTKLHQQVLTFMTTMGQHVNERAPVAPPDAVLRLRARLILEEAFEFAEAVMAGHPICRQYLEEQKKRALETVDNKLTLKPDMEGMADALADIDYVVEGARIALGIDGEPIADEVQRANMAKVGGPVVNGKKLKPEGWQPPNVVAELRKQGWEG